MSVAAAQEDWQVLGGIGLSRRALPFVSPSSFVEGVSKGARKAAAVSRSVGVSRIRVEGWQGPGHCVFISCQHI